MANLFDLVRWGLIVAVIVALIAGIAGTFAGMGEAGTDWFYELQETTRGPVLSPSSDNGLVVELAAATFGYDRYGSQEWLGILPWAFGFVMGMGALYLLYLAVRLVRAIVG